MGDRKLTLFELHLDGDANFGPQEIASGEEIDAEPTEGDRSEPTPDMDVSIGALLRVVAVVGVLALVARAVGRLVGGDEEAPAEIDVETGEAEAAAE